MVVRRVFGSPRDAALAVALGLVAIGGTVVAGPGQEPVQPFGPLGWALVLLAAVAWGARRAAPVGALAVIAATVVGYLVLGLPFGPVLLFVVLGAYALGRLRRARTAAVTCAVAALALAVALDVRLGDELAPPVVSVALLVLWPAVFVILPAMGGVIARLRAAATTRERRELVVRAAEQERLRVAREVHDTAGHGFALVTMQAGVALTVFDEQPDQVRRSLEAIRDTGERALRELHVTLDAMHGADARSAGAALGVDARSAGAPLGADARSAGAPLGADARSAGAPLGADARSACAPPGEPPDPAAGLVELVERARAGGLTVDLAIEGGAHPPPAEVGAVLVRVVQESLTNVVRHAGDPAATVRVSYRDHEVSTTVSDRGRGVVRPDATGSGGRGLAGLRARVEELGGTLRAAARPGGGFEVSARIPTTGPPR